MAKRERKIMRIIVTVQNEQDWSFTFINRGKGVKGMSVF